MRGYKKILKRYRQFKNHPVTQANALSTLYRYLYYNLKLKLKDELVIPWVEGLRFYVRKGDAGLVSNIYYGLYEFDESIFLLHLIREKDLFLDVGANLGHYSLLLSGCVKCQSIAIEPVPKTYSQLVRNIELNQLSTHIKTLNIGVAQTKEALYFSTDKGTMDRIVSSEYRNSVEVVVDTIDHIVENKTPIAIKMDVEGYEYFALQGAKNVLGSEKLKVLILELNQSGKKYGVEDDEIVNLLGEYGFKPYEYDFRSKTIRSLPSHNTHKFNTLFVKDEDFIQQRLNQSEKINIRGKWF